MSTISKHINRIVALLIVVWLFQVTVNAQTATDSLQLRASGNFLKLYAAPTSTNYGIVFPANIPSANQILQVNSISGTKAVTTWVTPTGGTVTGVTSGILSPLFTTSVATNTTTPAISYTLTGAGAYTVFGNNTNASAASAYFTPVLASSLFQNQGTTTTVLHGNASGAPTWSAVNLATDVTGTLPVANGGTGLASIPAYNLIYGNGTSAVSTLAPGTSGYILQSNGSTAAPTWVFNPATTTSVYLTTTVTSSGVLGAGYSGHGSPGITGTYINLPPGKWLIITTILISCSNAPGSGQGVWVRFNWGDANNSLSSAYAVFGNLISGYYYYPGTYGLAKGETIINNTTSGTITLYLVKNTQDNYPTNGSYTCSCSTAGGGTWGENNIIALPIK